MLPFFSPGLYKLLWLHAASTFHHEPIEFHCLHGRFLLHPHTILPTGANLFPSCLQVMSRPSMLAAKDAVLSALLTLPAKPSKASLVCRRERQGFAP